MTGETKTLNVTPHISSDYTSWIQQDYSMRGNVSKRESGPARLRCGPVNEGHVGLTHRLSLSGEAYLIS